MSKELSDALLWPLLDKEADLKKEYRKRSKKYELKRISHEDLESFAQDGWFVHRKLKKTIVVKKERPIDERLENLWWVLLYKMGYTELNSGRSFRILLKSKGNTENKSISVFASDDETVIVTQCIASDKLKKKSLKTEIEGLASNRGKISSAVKSFYGADFKPKILWFLVTENVIWSDDDIKEAESSNIKRITELELPYYTQLADHLGSAARFQFLAEFLKDQKIPELSGVKVPATRGKLGGRYFYTFVTTPKHLLKIAFVNHRTLDDPDGYPAYQRLIQKSRLKAIGKFISNGGYFPNNLLLNFVKTPRFDILQKDTASDVHFGQLYLPETYKSAWVIDGQHRLYGYAGLSGYFLDHNIVVIAFEKISKEEEANLFVTINHEQKSVPKNLLDDLEGQLNWGSAEPSERIGALCARLIQKLNRDMASPLYGRFSAEGIKTTQRTCLTVPQVKQGIKRSGLLGRVSAEGTYQAGPICAKTDNATLMKAQKILNGYFRSIQEASLNRWESGRPGKTCTNESIQALTLLFAEIIKYLYKGDEGKIEKISELKFIEDTNKIIEPLLSLIKSDPQEVDKVFSVPFGSGGPRELFFRLSSIIKSVSADFTPDNYDDWSATQSADLRQTADSQIQKINILVQNHIFTVFRSIHGEKNGAYWEKGIVNKDIKVSAYNKSQEDDLDVRLPLETYLDFIDFKKIVDKEWGLFKDVFDIPIDGAKGKAKNIEWMERINELRRIPAHASDKRNYKAEDFPFLDRIKSLIEERCSDYDYSSIRQGITQ